MGLDIYLHKTRHELYEENYQDVTAETEKDSRSKFAAKYAECVSKLTKVEGTPQYEETAVACLKELGELCSYPQYDLKEIGYDQKLVDLDKPNEYGCTRKWVEDIHPEPVQAWLDHAEKIINWHYDKEVGYFRKVNLLFAFCENQGILIDQYFAYITKDIALDLIDRCKRVLADHSLAEELLPTQSGFFFGSTEYSEWYFHDVEDVLKTFEKCLPIFDEKVYPDETDPRWKDMTYNIYIIFSW